MRKSSLIKEASVATLLIVLCYLAISFFPFRFELAKPFKQGTNDFDMYDLYFSGKNKGKNTWDTNIILVEIANTREGIARQVNLLKSLHPAVIGVDVMFGKPSADRNADTLLISTAHQQDSIVWASRVEADSAGHFQVLHSFFDTPEHPLPSGYINFAGDTYSVNRTFSPFLKLRGKNYQSFTASIAASAAPDKFDKLKRRNNKEEAINYSGNLESYKNLNDSELHSYYQTGQLKPLIHHKIVLLGFFKKNGPDILEDLHFTPLNERMSGRSHPDMYGVAVHANILSMILDHQYIKTKSVLFSFILAVLLTFLFNLFILSRYKKHGHIVHFKFFILQIILIIILIYLSLLLFSYFGIKIPLLPVILMIALTVEMTWVYKRFALWLHCKSNYHTIFSKH